MPLFAPRSGDVAVRCPVGSNPGCGSRWRICMQIRGIVSIKDIGNKINLVVCRVNGNDGVPILSKPVVYKCLIFTKIAI